MELLILIPFAVLLTAVLSAFFISRKLYHTLVEKGNKAAMLISIITFLSVGGTIVLLLAFIILSNLNFGR